MAGPKEDELPPQMLEGLLASTVAFGRAMEQEFDPRRFLAGFSRQIQSILPHDRLVLCSLSDDFRTFTVFAEHVGPLASVHEKHYTTLFEAHARYDLADWSHPEVGRGQMVRIDDFRTDPAFARTSATERTLVEMGFRSMLVTPLFGGGRVVGALVATSLKPGNFGPAHETIARSLGDIIAPFAHNMVLLQRERERRKRHGAVGRLALELCPARDVRDIFGRLAQIVKPLLDFDAIGITLITPDGKELDSFVDIDEGPGSKQLPQRMPIDSFSFSDVVLAGTTRTVGDTREELSLDVPGDRHVIEDGIRALLVVPIVMGERVGGALYFGKRRPHWYDAHDAELAEGIAPQLGVAIAHKRLEQERIRSEASEKRAEKLERRVAILEDEVDAHFGFERILGRASTLRDALAHASKVAPTETNVLITGESGTGKELVARAIHAASPRAEGPFLAINCAALPEPLLESELFGHERGAFTGADRATAGRFEQAAGGTLLLDEVGELAPSVQAKLLRVLQEREFTRLGGSQTRKADVRVLAATNRDLRVEVADKRFRDDLYYRLSVFVVHLPPLRERGEDVLLLAEHFVRAFEARMGKSIPGLSREARNALLAYSWPGNIRELSNAVERALILSDGGLITAAQLGLDPAAAPRRAAEVAARPGSRGSLAETERRLVVDALAQARGNKSRAADILGVTRSQLYTRLKRFGLEE